MDVDRPPSVPRGHGSWPLAIVAVALIAGLTIAAVVFAVVRGAREASEAAGRVGQAAGAIAAGFRTGTITSTFLASLPELSSAGSGKLELATSTVTESFTRSDTRRILWDSVELGETTVEIRVPVTYRYHVRLDDPWRLEVSDGTCIVHAPPIRPSLPPAVHTDRMEKRGSTRGWFALDAAEQLEELQKTLTPVLERYAADPRHVNAVRDPARRTVASFVRGWLLREDHWREDRFRAIVVRFDDEPDELPGPPILTIDE